MNAANRLQLDQARRRAQALDRIALPLVATGLGVGEAYARALAACEPDQPPARPIRGVAVDLFEWRRAS